MTKVYTTNTQIEFYAKVIPFGLYYTYRQLQKKKSLCELKLKIEKFENIHTHPKKEKRKRKTDTRWCKGTKKKKENIRKKKRRF